MAKYSTYSPSVNWFSRKRHSFFFGKICAVLCLIFLFAGQIRVVSAETLPATRSAEPAPQTVPGSMTVQPSFQEIIIDAAEKEKRGVINITNSDSEDVHVTLQATEIQQVDVQGNVLLADKPTSPATALASYISFDTPDFVLKAHGSSSVPFTIRNSVDLSPGGHYSALIARFAAKDAESTSVVPAISSFVIVRKTGGEQYHLSLSEVRIDSRWFSLPEKVVLRLNNQGNSHLTPHGLVEILDWKAHRTAMGIINVDSVLVLPQSERELSVPIRRQSWVWPLWVYTVKISGHAPPSEITFSQQIPVLIIHWPSLCILLLVLVLLGTTTVTAVRKIRRKQALQLKKAS